MGNPPWRRIAGLALISFGVLVSVIGVSWAGAYVIRSIEVLGQPDRSWLFWGLAVLFLGILLLALGSALILRGRTILRTD